METHAATVILKQPCGSVKPDIAGRIFLGIHHHPAGAGGVAGKIGDHAVFYHRQPGGFRSDPEIRPAVLKQINNPVAGEAGSVHYVKQREMNPVKTNQPVKRSEPEITVMRLDQGNDFVVRRAFAGAVFSGP